NRHAVLGVKVERPHGAGGVERDHDVDAARLGLFTLHHGPRPRERKNGKSDAGIHERGRQSPEARAPSAGQLLGAIERRKRKLGFVLGGLITAQPNQESKKDEYEEGGRVSEAHPTTSFPRSAASTHALEISRKTDKRGGGVMAPLFAAASFLQ